MDLAGSCACSFGIIARQLVGTSSVSGQPGGRLDSSKEQSKWSNWPDAQAGLGSNGADYRDRTQCLCSVDAGEDTQ